VESALKAIDADAVPAYNANMQKAGISLVTPMPPTEANPSDSPAPDDSDDRDESGG
jgi:hypothetical protein